MHVAWQSYSNRQYNRADSMSLTNSMFLIAVIMVAGQYPDSWQGNAAEVAFVLALVGGMLPFFLHLAQLLLLRQRHDDDDGKESP